VKDKMGKDRFLSNQNYAQYEYGLTKNIIIPLLKKWGVSFAGKRLLDVGCGLGGGTIAFWESGSKSTGLDIQTNYIKEARIFAKKRKADVSFILDDICSEDIKKSVGRQEIVIMRDVIEHIPGERRCKLMFSIREILEFEGFCFVSFPPYHSPFGGHQHVLRSFIGSLPYIHFLPPALELRLISLDKGLRNRIPLENWNRFWEWRAMARKEKMIITSFEKLVFLSGLNIIRRELYLIRPVFFYRYNLPLIKNLLFGKIPGLRELTTTGALYLLQKKS